MALGSDTQQIYSRMLSPQGEVCNASPDPRITSASPVLAVGENAVIVYPQRHYGIPKRLQLQLSLEWVETPPAFSMQHF